MEGGRGEGGKEGEKGERVSPTITSCKLRRERERERVNPHSGNSWDLNLGGTI